MLGDAMRRPYRLFVTRLLVTLCTSVVVRVLTLAGRLWKMLVFGDAWRRPDTLYLAAKLR